MPRGGQPKTKPTQHKVEKPNHETSGGEWVGIAWKLRLGGASYEDIAKQVGKTRPTVTKHLREYSLALAASREEDGVDPLEAYVSGLESDLLAAKNLAQERGMGSTLAARVGAQKLIVDIRQKLAAALGVVTERKAQDVTITDSWRDRIVAAQEASEEK